MPALCSVLDSNVGIFSLSCSFALMCPRSHSSFLSRLTSLIVPLFSYSTSLVLSPRLRCLRLFALMPSRSRAVSLSCHLVLVALLSPAFPFLHNSSLSHGLHTSQEKAEGIFDREGRHRCTQSPGTSSARYTSNHSISASSFPQSLARDTSSQSSVSSLRYRCAVLSWNVCPPSLLCLFSLIPLLHHGFRLL
jgi:hypothetical protein